VKLRTRVLVVASAFLSLAISVSGVFADYSRPNTVLITADDITGIRQSGRTNDEIREVTTRFGLNLCGIDVRCSSKSFDYAEQTTAAAPASQ
jgi:hypothetical protein